MLVDRLREGEVTSLTRDVESLQLVLVVTEGQVEHQQLLGVAASVTGRERTGEVLHLSPGGGEEPPPLAGGPGGGTVARAVVPGGREVPGSSHRPLAILKHSHQSGQVRSRSPPGRRSLTWPGSRDGWEVGATQRPGWLHSPGRTPHSCQGRGLDTK